MTRLNRQQQGRPARRPDYRITLEGQQISPEVNARLISLTLVDRRGLESDQLDITLSDHDGKLALPPRGAELQLAIGWLGEGLVDRGTFVVDEVEHSGAPDVLIIRARAADLRQQLPTKRSQSFHEISLGDIIATIAGRHDLMPRASDRLADIAIEHVDQTDESDAHFLTRLATRYDADATIKAKHLLFVPKGAGRTASGQPIPPITLTRSDGDNHRYVVTDRNAYTGVIAWWHDPVSAQRHPVLVGSDVRPKSLRGNQANADDALAEAQAEWQRVRRSGSQLTLQLAEGRPALAPETPVIAKGYKPDIDDTDWVATEVTHTISDGGYTCSVSCEVLGAEDENLQDAEEEFDDGE
ncbi:MAG: phage late control D family protein [Pseudohongiella sp.]|nr:phage late control D family protein [Pseudohongiella sp.]